MTFATGCLVVASYLLMILGGVLVGLGIKGCGECRARQELLRMQRDFIEEIRSGGSRQ